MCSLVLPGPLGCASSTPPSQAFGSTRDKLAELDEFGVLLLKAGLPTEFLPMGSELSPSQARQLRLHFDLNPPRLMEYSPWLVADVLLLEVARKQEATSRAELGRRVQEFKTLFVLRRDGYLAEALSGRPVQCVGPVEIRDGGLRAGTFEVDNFYRRDGNQRWQHVEMPASSASASR
ncbi:hypothetical protein JRI60_21610 [Archangium violaceum]|uniref:hypothetical protein n=1 Tax=Archangium violaceum TaxID=83451 RepID=UPI001951EFE8|nr:hypothetical protein [Archangium violaceum]QRO01428.1 hypothetical protein JRI60_21610 [Archangium violaceum]